MALFRPVTKLSIQVTQPARIPDVLRLALRTAMTGRQGPGVRRHPAGRAERPARADGAPRPRGVPTGPPRAAPSGGGPRGRAPPGAGPAPAPDRRRRRDLGGSGGSRHPPLGRPGAPRHHRLWPERRRPQRRRRSTWARSAGRAPPRPPRRAAGPTSCWSWARASGSSPASTTGATSSRGRRSSRSTSTAGTSAASIRWRSGSRPTRGETLGRPPGGARARTAVRRDLRGLARRDPGAPGPAPGAASRRGRARRPAREAAAGVRRAPAGAPARHDRHAGRRRGAGLRLRPAPLRPASDPPHPARPGRPRLRLPGGARGEARPPRGPGARHPRRRRLPDERAGARDGGAPRDRRRRARAQQQRLGLGEGVPAALLPGAVRGHRPRESRGSTGSRSCSAPGATTSSARTRSATPVREALACGQPAVVEIPIDPDELPVPATTARRRDG